MEDFCVSHNYTQRYLLLLLLRHRPPPPPSIHAHFVYTLFFRIEKNHPGIVFFLLETMQVEIKFTISFIWLLGYLVEIPQWERDRLLGVHIEHIRKQQTFVRNVIIEGVPHENKMAGKGQITSDRASSGNHATNRTRTS
jgi:hypothetical protein